MKNLLCSLEYGDSEIPFLTTKVRMQCLFSLLFYFFGLFRAAPTTCGGSQARGLIGAVAAGHSHGHSNARSELHLQPTPQLMLDP